MQRLINLEAGANMGEIIKQNVNLPFLPKPFDGEALFTRVRAVLGAPVESPKQSPR
jgi:hypothetical protein